MHPSFSPSATRGVAHGGPWSGRGVIFRLKILVFFLTISPNFLWQQLWSAASHPQIERLVGLSVGPWGSGAVGLFLG